MSTRHNEPMFNISEPTPLWLAGLLVAIHLVAYYGPTVISNPMGYWGILRPLGTPVSMSGSPFTTLIGHGFLHGSWGHVLMNSGMIVIFGVATIRGLRAMNRFKQRDLKPAIGFLQIFIFGVVAGGVAQWIWWAIIQTDGAALGASGGASALFATTAWAMGGKEKTISFGLAWALINVVLVVGAPILGVNVAWAAHMGGYLAGALAARVMVRAGSTRLGL